MSQNEVSPVTADRQKLREGAGALINELKRGQHRFDKGLHVARELRENREFDLLDELTSQLREAGDENPVVRRLQAQSLIERGRPVLALDVLESSAAHLPADSHDWAEAHGMMGRAWKQILLDTADKSSDRARSALTNAVHEYLIPVKRAPVKYIWQGLNLLALANFARTKGLPVDESVDCERLARAIISALAAKPAAEQDNWYYGSLAEAHLALNDLDAAEDNIRTYVGDPKTTAFALGGTLRQFTELWTLDTKGARENGIVQSLRAALMKKQHGVPVAVEHSDDAAVPGQAGSLPSGGGCGRVSEGSSTSGGPHETESIGLYFDCGRRGGDGARRREDS